MKGKHRKVCAVVLTGVLACGTVWHGQAMDWMGLVENYVDNPEEILSDIYDTYDVSDKFAILKKLIVDVMNSEWYQNTSVEERKDQIAEILASTGYVDKDSVKKGIDNILDFEFYGQKIGILLDDYTQQIYDESIDGKIEQRDQITDGLDEEKNALVLYGLGFSEIEYALDYSAVKWNLNGLNTNINTNCTVDDFRYDLNGNDLIVIEEHGNSYENRPVIFTEEEYTPGNSTAYQSDLDSGRVIVLLTEDGAYYCLTPDFFRYYYSDGRLDNSFIWIGSCYGASSPELVDAFVDTGAKAVMGHSNTVYTVYDYNLLDSMVDDMISGKSSSEAFQNAKNQWGDDDEEFAETYLGGKETGKPVSYPSLTGEVVW